MKPTQEVTLFWFRRDLRLDDNAGLYHALKETRNVLPVFIFDEDILDKLDDKQDRRLVFIHEALHTIKEQLEGKGSSLLTLHGTPLKAFQQLDRDYVLKAVYTNHDYEPQAIKRDQEIAAFLKKNDIPFHTYKDQTIFEKDEVLKKDKTPYTVFTPYSKVWKEQLTPFYYKPYPSHKLFGSLLQTAHFKLPSLKELGFEKTDAPAAKPLIPTHIIKSYEDTRNIPGIEGTTKLSVHLRFGTVSIRKLVQIALTENETWLNELIWRDFFMSILYHFPKVVDHNFKQQYDGIKWSNSEEDFERWCDGTTGYPIVDAGLRELNETGFMHNRVRMVTASFLCKHLLIDWRWGEAYFASKLNDYELSSNNGNWQWAAGTGCDAAPYFRVFNPEEQQKKFDRDFKYIKQWGT